ncbi:HIT family protein [Alkalihalobacillus oceani]|uniref:HIT family protein n=1 Tax=Halalkalibacter oceani TaxID=1653776 RepID=UPI00203DC85D|nr:HIT family protein [Halalkalibacter oceani]MCM3762630.1 HIT family protein [Halalkalibacter oceani]
MSEANCIFCKIVKGDIPAAKVYEDEHVLAFLDISQVTEGHTLVIPKNHHQDLFELPAEQASRLFSVIPTIANGQKAAFQPKGLNMVNNNGKDAGQTVFHYHVHLIPRYGQGDGFGAVWKDNSSQYSGDKLHDLAKAISSYL